MSKDVSSYIKDGNGGIIHSVFKSTINISIKGHIVSIQISTLPLSPLSLQVQEVDLPFSQLNIHTGDSVIFHKDRIVINQYTFYISTGELWEGKLYPTYITVDDSLIKLLISALKVSGKANGIGYRELASDNRFYKILMNNSTTKEGISHSWIDLSQIPAYKKNEDMSVYTQAIAYFIGAGPGLTPSGDDFILGFLSVLYKMREREATIDAFLIQLIKDILEISSKTTDISKEYIYFGCRGSFSERIHTLYQQIQDKDKEKTFSAAVNLIQVGSTSGSDTLTGIIYGLRFCQEILEAEITDH